MTVFDLPQDEIHEAAARARRDHQEHSGGAAVSSASHRGAPGVRRVRSSASISPAATTPTSIASARTSAPPWSRTILKIDRQRPSANTIFNFVPNTAETAYYGMMSGLREHRRQEVKAAILEAAASKGELDEQPRSTDLDPATTGRAVKRSPTRTSSCAPSSARRRGGSNSSPTSTTSPTGSSSEKDNLVVIDDSIVRGTTLRESILQMLSRTRPKKIVIVSTAPQIRYPDCYGIDMAELGKFIAFQAADRTPPRGGRPKYGKKFIREVSLSAARRS